MELAAVCTANGILVGGVYALIGMGIVIIYKATSVLNFAFAHMGVVGAFICYSLMKWLGMPVWVSVTAGILSAGLLGLAIERFALRKLIGQPLMAALIATLAVSIFLQGIVSAIWSPTVVSFPTPIFPKGGFLFFGAVISGNLIGSFIIAALAFAIFTVFFMKSGTGLAMRGVAEDHQIAQSLGVRVTNVFALTWFIAGLVCGIGGICLADKLALGVNEVPALAFRTLPAVLLGGLNSVGGVAIAGVVIGLAENFGNAYISQTFGEIVPWIIVTLTLIIRPEGLWGLRRIERI